MCSVIHLLDTNIEFIETKRNAIQRLYRFLASSEAETEPAAQENGHHKQIKSKNKHIIRDGEKTRKTSASLEQNIDKDLMLQTNDGFLNFAELDKRDHKRDVLAEDRRREYNEFLGQKSKKLENTKKNKRVTKGIALNDDYNELLNRKRLEERKHRQLNGFDGFEHLESHSPEADNGSDYKVATIGLFHCSNNKYVPEFITPRSRLLATHSSRLKAMQYREELRKQIEEKQRLKELENEKIRLEDEKLERKLETERLKMLAEYEAEQKLIRDKAKELTIKDDVRKQLTNKEVLGSASPLSLRSPIMHMRGSRAEGRRSTQITRSPTKSGKASKSLASAMAESAKTTRTSALQTSEGQSSIFSGEESGDSSEEEPNEKIEKMEKDLEFRQRVLSQLSDVRRMMESDHIKLREELRRQMSDDHID